MRAFYALAITVLGTSLFAGPALADTRSDVLDRAAHCSVLPQGRLWLDCFYGAAQPLRAAIGLPPAPQAQQYQQMYGQPLPPGARLDAQVTRDNSSSFFGIFGSTAAPPPQSGQADARQDVLRRAEHCNVLPEGRLWLDCFYGAAQPQRAALNLAPAPQALEYASLYLQPLPGTAGASVAEPEDDGVLGLFDIFTSPKVPLAQFGLKNARPGPGVNVDRVVDKIVNVEAHAGGAIITLANGQVWRQTDAQQIVWRKGSTAYTAVITHGAFTQFNLHIQEGRTYLSAIYKVERVR